MSRWVATERLVGLTGVPDGLVAWRFDQVVGDGDDRRVIGNRTGHTPVRRLLLRTAGTVPVGLVHAEFAAHLATGTRRRSVRTDAVAHRLARAGLVELVCDPTDAVGLACGPWQRWRRTDTGDRLAEAHRERLDSDEVLDGAARELAGTVVVDEVDVVGHWRAATERARHDLIDVRDRTVALHRAGELEGMPRSVAARLLLGDTHGLDDAVLTRPAARVALAVLGGSDQDPAECLDTAGILTDSTSAVVACHGVPAHGDGVAARMLAAAGAHVQLLLATHLQTDPDPVAAPTGADWVFCVENQALVQWAAAHDVDAPVVATTTTAGRMLAAAAARAGWRVAVTGDFEWGGLAVAAATFDAVPDAVAWRLSVDDYRRAITDGRTSGEPLTSRVVASPWSPDLSVEMARQRARVTEEDRFEELAHDLVTGRPSCGSIGPVEPAPAACDGVG